MGYAVLIYLDENAGIPLGVYGLVMTDALCNYVTCIHVTYGSNGGRRCNTAIEGRELR